MFSIAKFLIMAGVVLVILGLVLLVASKVPLIGKLPGDIYLQKKNLTFYFPLTTSILISIILSLIIWFLGRR